jgi:hypothetical protein
VNVQEIMGRVNEAIDPKKMPAQEARDFIVELIAELEILRDTLIGDMPVWDDSEDNDD